MWIGRAWWSATMKRLAGQDRSFLFFHKTMGRRDASGRPSSGLSQSTMRGLCRKG
jgi:hypothetical protein